MMFDVKFNIYSSYMYVYITKTFLKFFFFFLNVSAKQEWRFWRREEGERDLVLFFPCDRREFTKKRKMDATLLGGEYHGSTARRTSLKSKAKEGIQ